jgi:superfamily I DNA/RNA helicase
MQLTSEQQAILDTNSDLRIDAVAGSGKTTTLIEYARTRPPNSRILYLAFNRTVREEARRKFTEAGMTGVDVETAHSLAYRHTRHLRQGDVRSAYKVHELAELLGVAGTGEGHLGFVLANHADRFAKYFCNSDAAKVQTLNYLDLITEKKVRDLVTGCYAQIEHLTRTFLALMDRGQTPMIHDFYLKKFQLSAPRLAYDYILFDEAQDASPAMLDVILRQPCIRLIVGDVHQQIYGWRHAVNSMQLVSFPVKRLSTSFRFPQAIADLAVRTLDRKHILAPLDPVIIRGTGRPRSVRSRATIARTNTGLLKKAIDHITQTKGRGTVYFEGNINSYTYADEGASLYDVLNLHNGQHDRIRDKLVSTMRTMDDLADYVEQTDDKQLGMLIDLVETYGNDLHERISTLKRMHVDDDERQTADMVFSTVHRCKGLEYDEVRLAEDFMTDDALSKQLADDGSPVQRSRLNEELNLLYVAVTRARSMLHIPEILMPADLPASPHIIIQPGRDKPTIRSQVDTGRVRPSSNNGKGYAKKPVVSRPAGSTKTWTRDEDGLLLRLYQTGKSLHDIAKVLERTPTAVQMRLRKLNPDG